jgi:hypothetical protein
MTDSEQGKEPTRVTKFDVFALFASLASDIAVDIAQALNAASEMLQTHANFVEESQTFHEYAARTIETLQEGE